jgi:hypothetical protein
MSKKKKQTSSNNTIDPPSRKITPTLVEKFVNVLLTISSVPVEAPIIINGFED